MEIFIVAFVSLGVGFVVGRYTKKQHSYTEYVPVEPSEPRYLLTWKKGRMRSNDSAIISSKIMELRNANQPYECFLHGKQIYPKQK